MRLLFVVPLAGLALGAPASAQTPARADGNAAIKYWQAFGLLPALDKDQEKVLHEWDKAPLDAAALKLIEQSKNSLEYLHRGARLPRCDWALDYEDGIGLLFPHLRQGPDAGPARPPCGPGTSSSRGNAEGRAGRRAGDASSWPATSRPSRS